MKYRSRQLAAGTLTLAVCLASGAAAVAGDWTRWGGPDGDFSVDEFSKSWGKAPPSLVWKRDLGAGESAILVKGSTLYTMYRDGEEEVVIALEADAGTTIWEHRYAAPIPETLYVQHGNGPHAPPLIVGDRIYTVGISGKLHALALDKGTPVWSHDLLAEFEGKIPACGYGAAGVAWGELLIVPVGGEGNGIVAFRQADGKIAWKSQDYGAGYATPSLIDVDDKPQIVVFMAKQVAGLDPASGKLLWSHPHETQYGVNASPPIWGEDGILFVSSAYDVGSRGLKLSRSGGKTGVEELWHQRKMQIHFGTAVRIDDHVYGTSGSFGPAFVTAIDVKSGEIAWQERDVTAKGSLLRVGDHLMILDEKGKLVLARATPDELHVLAEQQLLDERVWAPPTLVGDRLYVRSVSGVAAFDMAGP